MKDLRHRAFRFMMMLCLLLFASGLILGFLFSYDSDSQPMFPMVLRLFPYPWLGDLGLQLLACSGFLFLGAVFAVMWWNRREIRLNLHKADYVMISLIYPGLALCVLASKGSLWNLLGLGMLGLGAVLGYLHINRGKWMPKSRGCLR